MFKLIKKVYKKEKTRHWIFTTRTTVKNGAKGTYLTAAVQRCCGGVALFLDGAALFL